MSAHSLCIKASAISCTDKNRCCKQPDKRWKNPANRRSYFPAMKVYTASDAEIDERLELDKRQNSRAFCLCFKTLDEAPDGFYDLQDKIRDGLEKEFWASFDDGIDRSRFQSWESGAMHTQFCFDSDMFGSERIEVEIVDEILGDKLIGVIMSYLEKCPPRYCVMGAVYREQMNGDKYIGRFVMNLDEIAVEESLADVWSKRVQFMEVEERK